MSRTTIIVLVALGAAVAGFTFSSAAGRLRGADAAPETSAAASPQSKPLGWRERFGSASERLVFTVDWLEVTRRGWRVRIGMQNDSSVAYEVDDPRATLDRAFGLMLFSTCEADELERLNESGELPEPRPATAFAPPLPALLEPRASWEGTMSASGALVAGSCARVVFGTLVAAGKPPDELPERIVWITDHAYRLRK